ncbi:PH domain-containing protein [Roseibium hamelinense]|nr:PH domain-containing protein [Roseibium hamelinense]
MHPNSPEHDLEPVPGLPAQLPVGEKILWQGAPDGSLVARRVLKSHWIAGYFGVLLIWTLVSGFLDGRPLGAIAFSGGAVFVMCAIVMGLIELFAWGVQKTTLYTITNKRIVMRIGVALSATFNLPFSQVVSADMRKDAKGHGDISLVMKPGHRLSFLVFWPHVRGWHAGNMVPQLVCLKRVEDVAAILGRQLSLSSARVPLQAVDQRPENAFVNGASTVAAE